MIFHSAFDIVRVQIKKGAAEVQIKVDINNSLTFDEITKIAEEIGYPALLLDAEARVLVKNRKSHRYTAGIPIGAKIRRYISADDEQKILQMKNGETFSCNFVRGDERFGVSVVCGQNCRLILFQPLSAGIFESIDALYGKMSGYDLHVTEDIEKYTSNELYTKEISTLILGLLDKHKTIHPLPFFDMSSALSGFIEETKKLSHRMSNYFEFDAASSEAIVAGSEQDFILMLAFVASIFVELSDKVYIELAESGGEAVCSISVDRLAPEAEILLLDLHKELRAGFDSKTNDKRLWFYLIKLLADANLWDVATVRDENGRVRFVLSAPITAPFEAIALRDSANEFIQKVASLFFS